MTDNSATRSTSTASSRVFSGNTTLGQVVAVRILLPVEELHARLHFQRVTQNGRPAVRRRAKTNGVGRRDTGRS